MFDICCIGHITLDKVITPGSEVNMPGGTSFYFSNALSNMDVSYSLLTSIAASESYIIDGLNAKGIHTEVFWGKHTVCFENIYSFDQDHRQQRVLEKADPFNMAQLSHVNAKIYHLGPLLADDIPVNMIEHLSQKGIVSLDVQGYLREVKDQQVLAIDWLEKKAALPHVGILKANETEMEVLTGCIDIREGAKALAGMGVKEVVITLGSKGSVIYSEGVFHNIPAYKPTAVVDATGCGDTYMAGYLYKKSKGASCYEAGTFAAAMATLKIGTSGPFSGTSEEVIKLLSANLQ
ncbi:sugar/nucleoside kinase (ribokinase family) [Arcticibacter tournemirensis]|uniref:Ribokinase n=1 Tax=Arcticibacter tournemirensis TaxID=699437 RepID=A0A5M9GN65_9SPHI|nr:PfkB family carbohydrate kinase [Arcticibacter tournemirensis]KAA8476112.1 ribokinase [Arcticibacter tournemirensis]TQM51284.1 sugar/nucleoside kinase (ribokinase family) [Arcticibacter tournemirensis]